MVDYIYVFGVVPSLCLGYAWILWRIKRSRIKELHSPFYSFFILAGIASCLNLVTLVLKIAADEFLPEVSIRDLIFNLIIYASHSVSLSHTIGKALVVATRFTAICFPLDGEPWTTGRIKFAALLMFIIPAFIFFFMVPPAAKYRCDESNHTVYIGVEAWAQELSKIVSASSYVLFIVVALPMCAVSIYHLRKELVKQERALLFYTIVITTAHLLKSAQQIVWFISVKLNDDSLFDLSTRMYSYANALTTYGPPVLLLIMSRIVRQEVLFGCFSRGRPNFTVSPNLSTQYTANAA